MTAVAIYCFVACAIGGICVGLAVAQPGDDVHIPMLAIGTACIVIAGVLIGLQAGGMI